MKRIIDLHTGKVKAGRKHTILESNAIDSCIVIAVEEISQNQGILYGPAVVEAC
jgi:hypothetical protein